MDAFHRKERAGRGAPCLGVFEMGAGKNIEGTIFDKTTVPVLPAGPMNRVVIDWGAVVIPVEMMLASAAHQGAAVTLMVGLDRGEKMLCVGERGGGLEQKHVLAWHLLECMGDHRFRSCGVACQIGRTVEELCCRGVSTHGGADGVVVGGDDKAETCVNGGCAAPGKQRPIEKLTDVLAWNASGTAAQGEQSHGGG